LKYQSIISLDISLKYDKMGSVSDLKLEENVVRETQEKANVVPFPGNEKDASKPVIESNTQPAHIPEHINPRYLREKIDKLFGELYSSGEPFIQSPYPEYDYPGFNQNSRTKPITQEEFISRVQDAFHEYVTLNDSRVHVPTLEMISEFYGVVPRYQTLKTLFLDSLEGKNDFDANLYALALGRGAVKNNDTRMYEHLFQDLVWEVNNENLFRTAHTTHFMALAGLIPINNDREEIYDFKMIGSLGQRVNTEILQYLIKDSVTSGLEKREHLLAYKE
jgi:hypothetical protein